MKKKFFLVALAALALIGCKDEQSELILDNNVKQAVISGTLVYLQDQAGAQTLEVPVAGQRVYFEVDAAKYGGATGTKLFYSDSTDANGAFSFKVPVGAKSISGDLKTDQIRIEKDGKAIYLKSTKKTFSVVADELRAEKIIADIDDVLTDNQGSATVKGKVTYNAGVVEKDGAKEDGNVAAPAGVKVTIAAKFADGNERTFVTQTIADGSYEIAIPVAVGQTALAATLSLAQFEGTFTELFNNAYLTKKAIYGLTTPIAIALNDGQQTVQDVVADKISTEDPTTKNLKIKVKGEIKVEAEVLTYSDNDADKDDAGNYSKLTGVKVGEKAYTPAINNGKFNLEFRHVDATDPTKVLQKVIYEVTVGNNGKYEGEFAVYDAWKLEDIRIVAVIDEFKVENFKHYYRLNEYKDEDGNWKTYSGWCLWNKTDGMTEDHSASQNCMGTYKMESAKQTPGAFFPVQLDATASFKMAPDSRMALRGAMADASVADKVNKDGSHTLYDSGLKTSDLTAAHVHWLD